MLIPKPVAGRLFLTGATLGPIIDGLHNQALLHYDVAPIYVQWTDEWSLATSWIIPPLLGFAYVVLGGVLPRVAQTATDALLPPPTTTTTTDSTPSSTKDNQYLAIRAVLAVLSTALIIRCSEVLVSSQDTLLGGFFNTAFFETASLSEQHWVLLMTLAITQWAWLDSTMTSLLVAGAAAIGGPLAEIPFIAAGCWEYSADTASNALLYFPVPDIALNSLTGPCYFAVTMDAIALGRWFSSWEEEEESGVVKWDEGAMVDTKSQQHAPINNAPTVLLATFTEDEDASPGR